MKRTNNNNANDATVCDRMRVMRIMPIQYKTKQDNTRQDNSLSKKYNIADEKKISVYSNVFDTVGKTADLKDMLLTSSYYEKVNRVRSLKDSEAKHRAKLLLPMFTPSGLFERRSKDGLIRHSGLICLDIDSKDNPDVNIQELKNDLADIAYYAGYSVSGEGLFVIVPIKYPEKHEQHFDSLYNDFKDMGITLDKACRDVSRARFVSYDDAPIFNPDADVYSKFMVKEPIQEPVYTDSETNIEKLTRKALETGTNITKDYKDWFALACSLRSVPSGRSIFHSLSSLDSRYSRPEADRQFDRVLNGTGYNEAKFFEICKRHGLTLTNEV